MSKTSDKILVSHLVEIFVANGIENIVISPGSRNAPLIIAFVNHPKINAISIVDERSAAFFALGMAQKLRKPVALASTSGTATLNYAPAIAEAYYQNIPLIILTADRPPEWINQGEGQSINQPSIYSNYVKASFSLPVEAYTKDELWFADRLVNHSIIKALTPPLGPTHLNIPLREPIYGALDRDYKNNIKIIHEHNQCSNLPFSTIEFIAKKLNTFSKIIILVGMHEPNNELTSSLNSLAERGIVILTETLSNVFSTHTIATIDRDITIEDKNQLKKMQPELLISLGHSLVSKRIKAFFRENNSLEHWHVGHTYEPFDTFKSLTHSFQVDENLFIKSLVQHYKSNNSDFALIWKDIQMKRKKIHLEYLKSVPWSDFQVFKTIFEFIPPETEIQLGNSTPVRYAQLFNHSHRNTWHGNRGTSGIEGSTSTAAGYAYLHKKLTLLISGDISFFYDSNALWNSYLSLTFRIIVINNQGGGIFRYIPGPDTTSQLDEFFVTVHGSRKAKDIAAIHNIPYYSAKNKTELVHSLSTFFEKSDQPKILEIFTDSRISAEILRKYFNQLNNI